MSRGNRRRGSRQSPRVGADRRLMPGAKSPLRALAGFARHILIARGAWKASADAASRECPASATHAAAVTIRLTRRPASPSQHDAPDAPDLPRSRLKWHTNRGAQWQPSRRPDWEKGVDAFGWAGSPMAMDFLNSASPSGFEHSGHADTREVAKAAWKGTGKVGWMQRASLKVSRLPAVKLRTEPTG
jgi:hypothetical protein